MEAIPVVEASEEALVEGEVSTEEAEVEVIKAMEGVEVDTKVHLKEAKPLQQRISLQIRVFSLRLSRARKDLGATTDSPIWTWATQRDSLRKTSHQKQVKSLMHCLEPLSPGKSNRTKK